MAYSLHFAISAHNAASLGDHTIAVWPVDRNWNDFGFGFQAAGLIKRGNSTAEENCFAFDLFVIPSPLGEQIRFNTWLEEKLKAANLDIAEPQQLGIHEQYFTIMRKEHAYRKFVNWAGHGPQILDAILRPLRDLVNLRRLGEEREAIEALMREKGVTEGVFRSESAYLAWHRDWRTLNGSANGLLVDARQAFSLSTKMEGFEAPHVLNINFGAPEPLIDRCHALIGANGTGKSRLLHELIVQLGQRAVEEGTDIFDGNNSAGCSKTELLPTELRFNRILALTWDSRTQLPFTTRLDVPFEYLHLPMAETHDTPYENHLNTSATNSDLITPLLMQMLRDGTDAIDKLSQALKPVLDFNRLAIALQPRKPGSLKWKLFSRIEITGEQNRLDYLSRVVESENPTLLSDTDNPIELSSGQRMFLNFGIRCAARITEGTLVILDEPETHLHPNLISDLMRMLMNLLDINKSIALVATHSPYVVRELPSRCVHVISVNSDRQPTISSAYLRTLGASVDRLSIDIFGDAESSQVNTELAKKIAQSGLNFDQIVEQYGRELSSEMLSLVRESMPKA